MSGHTKGPWHTFASSYAAAAHSAVEVNNEDGLTVAYAVNFLPEFAKESAANAALIASAPELLEAAQRMVAATEADQHFIGAEHDALKAAIAKATGQ